MPSATVTLTQCGDYRRERIRRAIQRHFELLGGMSRFVKAGDVVLLKPNLIAPRASESAVQTDPSVIVETARLLKDFGAHPFVGDSPAWSTALACVRRLGIEEELKRLGVPVKQLDKPKWRRLGGSGMVGISSAALDADAIFNLPKFKSHQQLVATFAVKNMFGCVAGKQKAFWHFAKGGKEGRFAELLIDVYRFLKPAVTLIDAVTVMDGAGPIVGRARPLGLLIGGVDPIACEVVCCNLVNIEPDELPIVRRAKEIGFGCWQKPLINIVGDDLPAVACKDFEMPRLIPIRFSFPHVCKSICKQTVLLARGLVERIRF